jgi:hypothetical protein
MIRLGFWKVRGHVSPLIVAGHDAFHKPLFNDLKGLAGLNACWTIEIGSKERPGRMPSLSVALWRVGLVTYHVSC